MNFNPKIGAAVIGIIGLSVAVFNYFSKSNIKIIDRQTTVKIIKQIKYQIMSSCIPFAQAVQKNILPKSNSKNKLEVTELLQKQIIKLFQQKQRLILSKYSVSAQELSHALDKIYKKDKQLSELRNDIETMMEQAIKGIFTDLNVPEDMKNCFNKQRSFKVFQEMLIMIAKNLIRTIMEELQKNKSFNIFNSEEFLDVIRRINIYDLKSNYLQKQGLNKYPGNVNQNFFKLIENYKKQDKNYANIINQLNAHYEKFVEQLPYQYINWTQQNIQNHFRQFQLKPSPVQPSVDKPHNKHIQNHFRQFQLKPSPVQPSVDKPHNKHQLQKNQEIIDDFNWAQVQNIPQLKKVEEPQIIKNEQLEQAYKQQAWWNIQPEIQSIPSQRKQKNKVDNQVMINQNINQQIKLSNENNQIQWMNKQVIINEVNKQSQEKIRKE